MLEGVLARILNQSLGWIVKDLDPSDLRVGIFGGDLVLKNLELRPDALSFLRLPVKIKSGVLGLLRIKVPWTNIQNESVIVEISDVYALVSAIQEQTIDDLLHDEKLATEERINAKKKELEAIDLEARKSTYSKEKQSGQASESYAQSFLGKLTAKIMNNLQVNINSIHFRFEHTAETKNRFTMGISLEQLWLRTIESSREENGIDIRKLPVLKAIKLKGFRLYWDSGKDANPAPLDESFKQFMGVSRPGKHAIIDDYTVDIQANVYLNDMPEEVSSKNTARATLKCHIPSVNIVLRRQQYQDSLHLITYLAAISSYRKYGIKKPVMRPDKDPRGWWKFIIGIILDDIRKSKSRISWSKIIQDRKQKSLYKSLYRRRFIQNKVMRNVQDLVEDKSNPEYTHLLSQLTSMEAEMDVSTVLSYREETEHELIKESLAMKNNSEMVVEDSASQGTLSWLFGKFYGTNDSLPEESVDSKNNQDVFHLSSDEQNELFEAIEYKPDEAHEEDRTAVDSRHARLIDLEFSLETITAQICSKHDRKLAMISIQDIFFCMDYRSSGSFTSAVHLDSFLVKDPTIHTSDIEYVVNRRDQTKRLLVVNLEKDIKGNLNVKLVGEPINVLANMPFIGRIKDFFSTQDSLSISHDLEQSILDQAQSLRTYGSAKLQVALKDRPKLQLDMTFKGATVLIPGGKLISAERVQSLVIHLDKVNVISLDPTEKTEEVEAYKVSSKGFLVFIRDDIMQEVNPFRLYENAGMDSDSILLRPIDLQTVITVNKTHDPGIKIDMELGNVCVNAAYETIANLMKITEGIGPENDEIENNRKTSFMDEVSHVGSEAEKNAKKELKDPKDVNSPPLLSREQIDVLQRKVHTRITFGISALRLDLFEENANKISTVVLESVRYSCDNMMFRDVSSIQVKAIYIVDNLRSTEDSEVFLLNMTNVRIDKTVVEESKPDWFLIEDPAVMAKDSSNIDIASFELSLFPTTVIALQNWNKCLSSSSDSISPDSKSESFRTVSDKNSSLDIVHTQSEIEVPEIFKHISVRSITIKLQTVSPRFSSHIVETNMTALEIKSRDWGNGNSVTAVKIRDTYCCFGMKRFVSFLVPENKAMNVVEIDSKTEKLSVAGPVKSKSEVDIQVDSPQIELLVSPLNLIETFVDELNYKAEDEPVETILTLVITSPEIVIPSQDERGNVIAGMEGYRSYLNAQRISINFSQLMDKTTNNASRASSFATPTSRDLDDYFDACSHEDSEDIDIFFDSIETCNNNEITERGITAVMDTVVKANLDCIILKTCGANGSEDILLYLTADIFLKKKSQEFLLSSTIPLIWVSISEEQHKIIMGTLSTIDQMSAGTSAPVDNQKSQENSESGNISHENTGLFNQSIKVDFCLNKFMLSLLKGDNGIELSSFLQVKNTNQNYKRILNSCALGLTLDRTEIIMDINASECESNISQAREDKEKLPDGKALFSIQGIRIYSGELDLINVTDDKSPSDSSLQNRKIVNCSVTLDDQKVTGVAKMLPVRICTHDILSNLNKLSFLESDHSSKSSANESKPDLSSGDSESSSLFHDILLKKQYSFRLTYSASVELLLSPSTHGFGLCMSASLNGDYTKNKFETMESHCTLSGIKLSKHVLENRRPLVQNSGILIAPFDVLVRFFSTEQNANLNCTPLHCHVNVSPVKIKCGRKDYKLIVEATTFPGPNRELQGSSNFDRTNSEDTPNTEQEEVSPVERKSSEFLNHVKIELDETEILLYRDWLNNSPPIVKAMVNKVSIESISFCKSEHSQTHVRGSFSFGIDIWNGNAATWDPIVETWMFKLVCDFPEFFKCEGDAYPVEVLEFPFSQKVVNIEPANLSIKLESHQFLNINVSPPGITALNQAAQIFDITQKDSLGDFTIDSSHADDFLSVGLQNDTGMFFVAGFNMQSPLSIRNKNQRDRMINKANAETISGWIFKLNLKRSSWEKRFCVLKDNTLNFYRSSLRKHSNNPVEVIALLDCPSDIRLAFDATVDKKILKKTRFAKECAFQISTGSKVHHIVCSSFSQKADFVRSILLALEPVDPRDSFMKNESYRFGISDSDFSREFQVDGEKCPVQLTEESISVFPLKMRNDAKDDEKIEVTNRESNIPVARYGKTNVHMPESAFERDNIVNLNEKEEAISKIPVISLINTSGDEREELFIPMNRVDTYATTIKKHFTSDRKVIDSSSADSDPNANLFKHCNLLDQIMLCDVLYKSGTRLLHLHSAASIRNRLSSNIEIEFCKLSQNDMPLPVNETDNMNNIRFAFDNRTDTWWKSYMMGDSAELCFAFPHPINCVLYSISSSPVSSQTKQFDPARWVLEGMDHVTGLWQILDRQEIVYFNTGLETRAFTVPESCQGYSCKKFRIRFFSGNENSNHTALQRVVAVGNISIFSKVLTTNSEDTCSVLLKPGETSFVPINVMCAGGALRLKHRRPDPSGSGNTYVYSNYKLIYDLLHIAPWDPNHHYKPRQDRLIQIKMKHSKSDSNIMHSNVSEIKNQNDREEFKDEFCTFRISFHRLGDHAKALGISQEEFTKMSSWNITIDPFLTMENLLPFALEYEIFGNSGMSSNRVQSEDSRLASGGMMQCLYIGDNSLAGSGPGSHDNQFLNLKSVNLLFSVAQAGLVWGDDMEPVQIMSISKEKEKPKNKFVVGLRRVTNAQEVCLNVDVVSSFDVNDVDHVHLHPVVDLNSDEDVVDFEDSRYIDEEIFDVSDLYFDLSQMEDATLVPLASSENLLESDIERPLLTRKTSIRAKGKRRYVKTSRYPVTFRASCRAPLHIVIYSSYCVVNWSGLPLLFSESQKMKSKTSKSSRVAPLTSDTTSEGYEILNQDEENDAEQPWGKENLSIDLISSKSGKLRISLENESSAWSKKFDMVVGMNGKVIIPASKGSQVIHEVGVSVSTAPGRFLRTKLVRFTPQFLIVNKSNLDLALVQQSVQSQSVHDQMLHIPSQSTKQFHPVDVNGDGKLDSKDYMVSLQYHTQLCEDENMRTQTVYFSRFFQIDVISEHILKLESKAGYLANNIPVTSENCLSPKTFEDDHSIHECPSKDLSLSLDIALQDGMVVVFINEYSAIEAPVYRIDNLTSRFRVGLIQKGEPWRTISCISPGNVNVPWIFQNPEGTKDIEVMVERLGLMGSTSGAKHNQILERRMGSRITSIPMDVIGFRKKISYYSEKVEFSVSVDGPTKVFTIRDVQENHANALRRKLVNKLAHSRKLASDASLLFKNSLNIDPDPIRENFGYVLLSVNECRDLPNLGFIDSMDPYVKVIFGTEEFHSSVQHGYHPVFDDVFIFKLDRSVKDSVIRLEVYDNNMISRDKFLGSAVFSLDEVKQNSTFELWLNFQDSAMENHSNNKVGQIRICGHRSQSRQALEDNFSLLLKRNRLREEKEVASRLEIMLQKAGVVTKLESESIDDATPTQSSRHRLRIVVDKLSLLDSQEYTSNPELYCVLRYGDKTLRTDPVALESLQPPIEFKSPGDDHTENRNNFTIRFHINEPLGIELAVENDDIVIRNIAAGGQASTYENLAPGDRVLNVNGDSVVGFSLHKFSSLVKELQKKQSPLMLTFCSGNMKPETSMRAGEADYNTQYTWGATWSQYIEFSEIDTLAIEALQNERCDSNYSSRHIEVSVFRRDTSQEVPLDMLAISSVEKQLAVPLLYLFGDDVQVNSQDRSLNKTFSSKDRLIGTGTFILPDRKNADASKLSLDYECSLSRGDHFQGLICLKAVWEPLILPTSHTLSKSLSIFIKGIGMSVVDTRRRYRRELFYLSAKDIEMYNGSHGDGREIYDIKVKTFQLDNQMTDATYPVVLSRAPVRFSWLDADDDRDNVDPDQNDSSSFEATFAINHMSKKGSNILYVEYAQIFLQEMSLKLDEGFLVAVQNFIAHLSTNTEESKTMHTDSGWESVMEQDIFAGLIPKSQQKAGDHSSSELGSRILIGRIDIKPMKLNITFTMTSDGNERGDNLLSVLQLAQGIPVLEALFSALLSTVVNVSNAPLLFESLQICNESKSMNGFVSTLTDHYVRQAMGGVLNILGSTDILGSPVHLVESFGKGAYSFFYEPALAMSKGYIQIGSGLTKGGMELILTSAKGVSETVIRVTETLSKVLTLASLDGRYISRQNRLRQNNVGEPVNIFEGVISGSKQFWGGVFDGVSGIVYQPIYAANHDSNSRVRGFFLGVGQGFVGIAIKPTVGVLEAVRDISIAIRNSTETELSTVYPIRLRRYLPFQALGLFSGREAHGFELLRQRHLEDEFRYIYHMCIFLPANDDSHQNFCEEIDELSLGEAAVLILTDLLVIAIQDGSERWCIPVSAITSVGKVNLSVQLHFGSEVRSGTDEHSQRGLHQKATFICKDNESRDVIIAVLRSMIQGVADMSRSMRLAWDKQEEIHEAAIVSTDISGSQAAAANALTRFEVTPSISNEDSILEPESKPGIIIKLFGSKIRHLKIIQFKWDRDKYNSAYVKYKVVVVSKESNYKWHVWKRYSEFRQLRDKVTKLLSRSRASLPMPSRTLLSVRESDLPKRMKGLNSLVDTMMASEAISEMFDFRVFFTQGIQDIEFF